MILNWSESSELKWIQLILIQSTDPDRENTARLTDDGGEYYVSEAYHTNERL